MCMEEGFDENPNLFWRGSEQPEAAEVVRAQALGPGLQGQATLALPLQEPGQLWSVGEPAFVERRCNNTSLTGPRSSHGESTWSFVNGHSPWGSGKLKHTPLLSKCLPSIQERQTIKIYFKI